MTSLASPGKGVILNRIIKGLNEIKKRGGLTMTNSEIDTSSREFKKILSNQGLIRGLEENYFFRASSIQRLVISQGNPDRCCVIQAKAGMGKTLAFACSVLDSLEINIDETPSIRILIISPTREIAHQTAQVFKNISRHLKPVPPEIGTFIGGINISQDQALIRICHIAIGTPGRIKTLITTKHLSTENISTLILDEADKLVEEVFFPDISFIFKAIPNKRVITASATFQSDLLEIIESNFLCSNPQYFMVDGDDVVLEDIQQYYLNVSLNNNSSVMAPQLHKYRMFQTKTQTLIQILSKVKFYQAIVFLNNQPRALELTKKLESAGWPAAYTSGKLNQKERMDAMDQTRRFNVRVLVCSDLISRGVDVERVDLVINMDLPKTLDTYFHRVGRTGRFGTKGLVVSLVDPQEDKGSLEILKESLGEGFSQLENIQELTSSGRNLRKEDVLAFSKLKVIEAKSKNVCQTLLNEDLNSNILDLSKQSVFELPKKRSSDEVLDNMIKHFKSDNKNVKDGEESESGNTSASKSVDELYTDDYSTEDPSFLLDSQQCEQNIPSTIPSISTPSSRPSGAFEFTQSQAPLPPQVTPTAHPSSNPFHVFWLKHFANPRR